MFVLGIDPGLAVCGYAVVEKTTAGERAITAGVVRTDSGEPIAVRLAELHRDLSSVVQEHEPDVMAIEQVFTNRNLQTAISVGRASGVALLVAAQAGIPVHEYSPSAVKASVAGYGKATKDQIRYIVTSRLKLKSRPEPADAADALAIALCYLQGGVGMEHLHQAGTLQ
ncbi:MAG: crossover junction endodeoxyribonuclease RuvC [Acidimicrobiia bacterium]|nr:crossover junction endodeoxyribonuclease RuvC [Acidimicrobiia bacterium]MBT8192534.1 crossover junction endodeoxyribonuclease RuvC [Acidimicrobiia bacterium]MBT8247367.1 crossover junction endodeoxyribonuclease RuvC [Acidimicrobiia bacterium]NNF88550.1 crossover junction endodeoxyribonuclease RuvC [Acidimicrobiia bacterium]NNJ48433.1 crossover junction endodeoxyribonuclease RuvC [Acidimicrobiia bacterium]